MSDTMECFAPFVCGMMAMPAYYRLADGRIWSVTAAAFVSDDTPEVRDYIAAGRAFGSSPDEGGDLSEDGLRQTLVFYGLPLGALLTLEEARAAARAEILSGYEAALMAGLTMPSVQAPASALELALAIADWQAESPEDFADLRAIHTARRDELLAAVAAAESVEAVRAVEVSYAV